MTRSTSIAMLAAVLILTSLSFFSSMKASSPESPPRTTPTLAPTLLPSEYYPMKSRTSSAIARPESAVLEAVQAALPELFRIASADPEAFGMGPNASLERTKLLNPYPTYHLARADAASPDRDQDLVSRLKLTGAWHVPVDWGDGPGAIIYVTQLGGTLEVAGIGGRNTLIALRSALASIGSPTEEIYFVDELPNRPDIIVAKTPRGLVAVALTKDNIERSLHGLPLSAARALDVINSTLP